MSKPARRLAIDAREDDLEALREHAAQQGAAIRPPERQERRDARLFSTFLDPGPSKGSGSRRIDQRRVSLAFVTA